MFLPLLLLTFFTVHGHSSEYYNVQEKLSAITNNHLQLLKDIEYSITANKVFLSSEECELLIEQLETIKKELCARPNAGFLVLPMLAALLYGAKTWLDYAVIESWKDAPLWLEMIIDRKKQEDICMHDLLHFIILLCGACIVNLEYHESVDHLFRKERILERNINKLIATLKTA